MSQFWPPLPSDTGWVTPSLATGWTVFGGETPQYRIRNRVVYLRGRATTTGAVAGAFTLPSTGWPQRIVVWQAEQAAASRQAIVTTAGVVGQATAGAGSGFSFGSCPPFLTD